MIKDICKDTFFLSRPSAPAAAEDAALADDLIDTLNAHREGCVGMAANMIGRAKRIIVFFDGGKIEEMFNPEIISKSGAYEAEEGCLSLSGRRSVTRYRQIKVRWQTRDMKPRTKNFSGFTAQIIQHEVDHLSGKII